jgi:hypothetical protein
LRFHCALGCRRPDAFQPACGRQMSPQ